jgi:hypothetical protein
MFTLDARLNILLVILYLGLNRSKLMISEPKNHKTNQLAKKGKKSSKFTKKNPHEKLT